jgi:hypothetical protein
MSFEAVSFKSGKERLKNVQEKRGKEERQKRKI